MSERTFYRPLRTVGDVADEIRRLRHEAGFTQAQLAQRAGVSRRWVNQIERGHPRGEIDKLMRVARALGLVLRFGV